MLTSPKYLDVLFEDGEDLIKISNPFRGNESMFSGWPRGKWFVHRLGQPDLAAEKPLENSPVFPSRA